MNRLIIIGNGFDLAHNLKTKYNDFISDYWSGISHSEHCDNFIEFYPSGNSSNNFGGSKSLQLFCSINNFSPNGRNYSNPRGIRFAIKNDLFHSLSKLHSEVNWVDIEMQYYSTVRNIVNSNASESDKSLAVKKVNKEIYEITSSFESYLNSKVVDEIAGCRSKAIEQLFINPFADKSIDEMIAKEFPFKRMSKIKKWINFLRQDNLKKKFFKSTLVLNFNYTDTVNHYFDEGVVNIHGKLGDVKNPILLGFGDEKDELYRVIENTNENEFLRFMKSSHYAKTPNHKNLFDFIDSDEFQVQILGHSCGLSDRTLLNSIFEHENCYSIKVFYYKYGEPNELNEADNYSELFKNISRHFSNKISLREKVVNHEYCTALPQS